MVSNIKVGGAEARATDVLGSVYEYVSGLCRGVTLEEIRKLGHVLTPGRYVGAVPQSDDGVPFDEKMARLSAHCRGQKAEAQRLDAETEVNLARLGSGAKREDTR